jgi:peptide/nickel transport system permease protein
MQQYIIRRTLLNFLVIFLVATAIFAVLRIDTTKVVRDRAAGCFSQSSSSEECLEIARAELGLDKPIPEQYVNFLVDTVQLDFGQSFKSRNDVMDDIQDRIMPTVELGLLQLLVAIVVALPIGIVSAVRQDSWVDYLLRFFSIAFLGIPVFVVAIITIMLTARYAEGTFLPDWFGPHSNYVGFREDPMQNLKLMFAPALIGGLGTGAVIMRFLRSQMLEVLRQDYERTAWSKGLRERVIIVRHALRNALIPVLTLIGILLGSIVSANIVLEDIYGIRGIGSYIVFSVAQTPDFPVIQGIVILVALALVFINLLVDLAYGWLDPRIRYS